MWDASGHSLVASRLGTSLPEVQEEQKGGRGDERLLASDLWATSGSVGQYFLEAEDTCALSLLVQQTLVVV